MKKQIIFATGNRNKVREIREILNDPSIEILTQKEAGIDADPEENGTTFEENALIKARSIARTVREMEADGRLPGGVYRLVMSDDSGLVVDALDGAPGILSARYMGRDTDYRIKMTHIMDLLKDVPEEKRTARFSCAAAAVLPDGRDFAVLRHMEGRIGHEIVGENGFGYDPFFYLPQYGKTSAQISPAEKNAISHRGQALRALARLLREQGVL